MKVKQIRFVDILDDSAPYKYKQHPDILISSDKARKMFQARYVRGLIVIYSLN